jgi:predicted nucleic acid-binding protein
MSEPNLKKFKNEKEQFENSVSHLLKRTNDNRCIDASEAIALYLKKNFIVNSQVEVLQLVHKLLEDWYVEKIAGAREVLEKKEEDLKIFNSVAREVLERKEKVKINLNL